MNSITYVSWLWIQTQFAKCWGTSYFSIELYYCVCAMPFSWNKFMKWANSCVHKHLFKNSITYESWLWIQPQFTKCWGTAYFTAYYSIELYIKFKRIDSFTNIISWICLCCINRGYYNFMCWGMHEIHSINIVYIKFKKFDSFTNIISWICLCYINRGYYNFIYWRMHEIHSINIVKVSLQITDTTCIPVITFSKKIGFPYPTLSTLVAQSIWIQNWRKVPKCFWKENLSQN